MKEETNAICMSYVPQYMYIRSLFIGILFLKKHRTKKNETKLEKKKERKIGK